MSISDLSDSDADMYVPQGGAKKQTDKSLEDQFALLQKQQEEMAALQNGLIQCPPSQQPKNPPNKTTAKQSINQSQFKAKAAQPASQSTKSTVQASDPGNLQMRQLQQRVHELEQRNQQLERAASFMEPGAVDTQTLSDPTVSKKFVELNGKIRQLTAANEALKAKGAAQQRLTAQYQLEIEQLHRQLERLTGKAIGPQSDNFKSEEEQKWIGQIKKLEQDNQGLLERFGELNVKLASFQNENLRLKQFILREAGVEYDKLNSDTEWKGRGERIEVLKLQVEKQQQRVKELESCLQKVQRDPDEAQRANIQQIKARCSEQLEIVEKALEEKKVLAKSQAEQISELKERLDRLTARSSALETTNSRSREQLRLLAKKSKLDDQLIADFRQQLFQNKTKAYQLQFRDEIAQLRAQNAALEQKLTQALLSLQQNNTDQLQVIYAGAQLELADCRERLQILNSERIAIFQRLFELEERRLTVSDTNKSGKSGESPLIDIVREMQGFQRVQAGLNAEFVKKQTALCQQFYRILLEHGLDASQLPLTDVQALQERITEDTTNYVAQAQATIAKELGTAPPKKRVQKGGQNVVRGTVGGGVQEYLAQQPKPKPLSGKREASDDIDDAQQQKDAQMQLEREFAQYVAPDDEPSEDVDHFAADDFQKQVNDLDGGKYDDE